MPMAIGIDSLGSNRGSYMTIDEKKEEIANYERILAAYKGRWYDQGKRHLDELKSELNKLQDLEQKLI